MRVIIRNNLSGVASQCHLSSIGEALAFRKALSLRQRLPSLGATTTTAASGGNRESLLGQRPARRKRSAADAGCRNPALSSDSETERLIKEDKPMDFNKAALEMHETHHGKVGIVSKVEVKTRDDLSTA